MSVLDQQLKEQRLFAESRLREAKTFKRYLEVEVIGIEPLEFAGQSMECAKVYYDGLYGFIPKDKVDDYEFHSLDSFIGSSVEVIVDDIITDDFQTIFLANRTEALKIKSDLFWKNGRVGDVVPAFISGVDKVNAYLIVNGIRVRMPKMEYSFHYVEDMREQVRRGDTIDVKITAIDAEEKKIRVSRRALEADPRILLKEYKEGGRYAAIVNNFDYENDAIFVSLLPHKVSARAKFPAVRVGQHIEKGDSVSFHISNIDLERGFVHGRIIVPKVGQIGQARGKGF